MKQKYIDYCIKVRRDIHMYPETGFDIEKTINYITNELDKFGVKYYKNIGISSLVAVILLPLTIFTPHVTISILSIAATSYKHLYISIEI